MKYSRMSLIFHTILIVLMIVTVFFVVNVNNNLNSGQRQRQTFNAEERFLDCAGVGINDPKKQADIDKMCAGYDTLYEAYDSERNR